MKFIVPLKRSDKGIDYGPVMAGGISGMEGHFPFEGRNIWYYKIYQLLARTELISRYSPMDIIDFLQETRKIKIDGKWYLKEATAKTAKVLKKMGLDLK